MSDNNSPWPAPPPDPTSGYSTHPTAESSPFENYRLANFWVRVVAHIVDIFTVALIGLPFRIASTALNNNSNPEMGNLLYVLSIVLSIYMYAYWTGIRGGTPLRCKLGVYIVDQDTGGFVGMRRGLTRVLMSQVSALVFLIGYFWMFGNPRKQTWHDLVAKTVVISG